MPLFSSDYIKQNERLHEQIPHYGASGHYWLGHILDIMEQNSYKTVLDYGSGKGTLGKYLRKFGYECQDYDPAVPGAGKKPQPADLVCCLDVLEHIEPDCILDVILHLRELSLGHCLAVVALREATKTLPDGRNVHLICEGYVWWKPRLEKRFEIDWVQMHPEDFFIALMRPKRKKEVSDEPE